MCEMCFLRQPRLLPRFLEFLVKFLDRQVELVDLPDLARQFRFETIDASRQLLDLLEVRRSRQGDQLMHALVLNLDHLVELTDGPLHRLDSLRVDNSDLSLP